MLETAVLLLILCGAIFAYAQWKANYKPKSVYPRGSRKHVADRHPAQDSAAKLLSEVLALKERGAQWAEILKTLNPQDEPRVRTILLELRGPHMFVPHTALKIIESACLDAKNIGKTPSRVEILEHAKTSMDKVLHQGN